MAWRLTAAAVVACALVTACSRDVREEDVFLAWMAAGTTFTVQGDDGLLFVRNRPMDGLWDASKTTFEEGTIATPVGDMGYRLARPGVAPAKDGPLFVHCGGNAFAIPNHGDLAAWTIIPHGDALLWDYPGYGLSAGEPSAAGLEAAARAVAEAAPRFRRRPDQPIVFIGHSLGGFVCGAMAAATPEADAMIFEASAANAQVAAGGAVPWGLRPFLRVTLAPELAAYDNVAALSGRRDLLVLVLAARRDRILPRSLSRDLAAELEAAGHAVTYAELPDATHFDIGFQPETPVIVAAFLKKQGL